MIYATLLLAVLAVLVWSSLVMHRLRISVDENTAELKKLRVTSRARVTTAAVQSGEVSQEQLLRRLGRASHARRVVVGGDEDSQLNHDLRTSPTEEESDASE